MKKVIIIGAGITGLSAAWKLSVAGYNVQILESNKDIGGLAKTIKIGNFNFDIGPHSFFTENKKIYDLVKSLFQEDPEQFPNKSRSVKMYFMGKYVEYPLSAKGILFKMGPIVPFLCFISFLKSYFINLFNKNTNKEHHQLTVKDWAINNFGNFLYINFFKPYTEQFWKIKTEELSHRVIPSSKKLDFAQTLKHLALKKFFDITKVEPTSLNVVQRESLPTFYPKKGFGEIGKRIADKVIQNNGIILTEKEVLKINYLNNNNQFEVITNSGKYNSDILISTIGLNSLVPMINLVNTDAEILNNSQKLEYLCLIVVNIITNKKNILDCQYCYFLNRPYNRATNLSLFSEDLSPENLNIFSLEISCHHNSKMWLENDKEIFNECLESLENDMLLTAKDILDYKIIKVKDVYPIYKKDYEVRLNNVTDNLKKIKNFSSIGRQGQFYYGDIDQMMQIGFDTAENIINEKVVS